MNHSDKHVIIFAAPSPVLVWKSVHFSFSRVRKSLFSREWLKIAQIWFLCSILERNLSQGTNVRFGLFSTIFEITIFSSKKSDISNHPKLIGSKSHDTASDSRPWYSVVVFVDWTWQVARKLAFFRVIFTTVQKIRSWPLWVDFLTLWRHNSVINDQMRKSWTHFKALFLRIFMKKSDVNYLWPFSRNRAKLVIRFYDVITL